MAETHVERGVQTQFLEIILERLVWHSVLRTRIYYFHIILLLYMLTYTAPIEVVLISKFSASRLQYVLNKAFKPNFLKLS